MATVNTIGDGIAALKSQLLSVSYQSTYHRERARGLLEQFGSQLISFGINVNPNGAPAASSVGDALGGLRQQIAAGTVPATFPSNYAKNAALGLCDRLRDELAATGVTVTG